MNFRRMLDGLFGRGRGKAASSQAPMQPGQPEMMDKLLGMLERTQAVELDCDQVFAVLDQFAEMVVRGEDVARLLPLVKQHLDMCADCREEYRVLVSILENSA